MQILLSGGGESKDVIALDNFFVSKIILQKPILYIPVALEGDPTYTGCYSWFKETYSNYGIENFEMCSNLGLVSNLDRFSAIFIGGGNTFKLLKEIKENRFDEQLMDYLNGGGFVYGGSAGAIIFGKTIKSAKYADDNNVGLSDLSGFNLVGGNDIFCHYSIKDNEFIANYDNDLYILYEESGIYINCNKIECIGRPYLNKIDITKEMGRKLL